MTSNITIAEVLQFLEKLAPSSLQESYDNATLIVGDPKMVVTGILTTLDCTEAIVKEAVERGCNLIVAHHPIVFRGLKSLTGKTYIERVVIQAIKLDIAIYAIHTNYDNVLHGVNAEIARRLKIKHPAILQPKDASLLKLETFVPKADADAVLKALYKAGAGTIGNYSECSFQTEGKGTFKPSDRANPTIGSANNSEVVEERKLEVLVPKHAQHAVIKALREYHPYEEVAYYLIPLGNSNQEIGSGMVGDLAHPTDVYHFLEEVKHAFGLKFLKHTKLVKEQIQRIAICGGSGSFLLKSAIRARADVFITSDFKYHEFFDAEDQLTILDIGHYETEQFTRDLLAKELKSQFSEVEVLTSGINTNPVHYF